VSKVKYERNTWTVRLGQTQLENGGGKHQRRRTRRRPPAEAEGRRWKDIHKTEEDERRYYW